MTFRVFTQEQALAYVQGLLPVIPPTPRASSEGSRASASAFFGEAEHAVVKAYVVESTTAVAHANALLRRAGLPEVADPPSTGPAFTPNPSVSPCSS